LTTTREIGNKEWGKKQTGKLKGQRARTKKKGKETWE
jgi:hypothetical protein